MTETFKSMQGDGGVSPLTPVADHTAGALALPSVGSACRTAALGPLESCTLENESKRKWAGSQTEAHRSGQSHRTEAPSSAQMVSRGEPGPTSCCPNGDAILPGSSLRAHTHLAQRSFKLQIAEGVGDS